MSWLPGWAQKMAGVFHREEGAGPSTRPSPRGEGAVNRLLVIRAEVRALEVAARQERNGEQLEAMDERLRELKAETRELMGVGR